MPKKKVKNDISAAKEENEVFKIRERRKFRCRPWVMKEGKKKEGEEKNSSKKKKKEHMLFVLCTLYLHKWVCTKCTSCILPSAHFVHTYDKYLYDENRIGVHKRCALEYSAPHWPAAAHFIAPNCTNKPSTLQLGFKLVVLLLAERMVRLPYHSPQGYVEELASSARPTPFVALAPFKGRSICMQGVGNRPMLANRDQR